MDDSATRVLHILTPLSDQTPSSLVTESIAAAGDLVADLRQFPSVVHEIGVDQACVDVTADLFTAPDYWTVVREWLTEFTRQTGLQDILAIEGHGFWWTLNGQKFVAGLTEFGNLFAWIDLLEAIHRRVPPDLIVMHGRHSAIVHVVQQVCEGTRVQIRPEAVSHAGWTTKIPRHVGLLAVRVLLGVAYLVYSLFRRPDICVFSGTNLLRKTSVGSRRQLHDVYLGDVTQALQARGWRVAVVEKYGWNASWRGLLARGFFFPSDIVFLLSAPLLRRMGLYRRTTRKWRKKWADVEPTLRPCLRYRSYDIAPMILPVIASEFTDHAPDLEVMIGFWHRILSVWRPKLLYVNDSYSRAAVTAVIPAKLLKIATVEQQHGIIGRNHIAYLVPRQLRPKSSFPLCDVMVVWGEHTKRFLVGAGVYEPEQVHVCGFPRADSLRGELAPSHVTRAQLGIPPAAQVILYTSNGFAHAAMPDILEGIQRGPTSSQVYWLIKLHPREKTRHLWELEIERRQLRNIQVIEGGFDFYALLAACDIHVSFASTTLVEAAILGKPNLGLDVAYTSDPAGYAEANAFLPVAPNRLGLTVSGILANAERRQDLLAEQKAFATDWCMHDGQAIRRIVALIEAVGQDAAFRRGDDAAL